MKPRVVSKDRIDEESCQSGAKPAIELRGWSQEDVAKKIGAPDDKTVRRWESGKVSPTPSCRQKLCTLYGKSTEELGFLEENGLPTWNVAYRRNPFFTGREDVLTSLAQMLTAEKWGVLTQAISGLGGIGKTQIAVEYAYRHREQSRFILWVRAATPETLISEVTPSGFLWLQTLARMANDAPFTVSQSDIKDKELHQSAAQHQKNRALIQLLRSWREGDEQEQRSTWEYLLIS